MRWHFYEKATGLLMRQHLNGRNKPPAPAGFAVIPGDLDPLSQRVDITATPPPPVIDPQTGQDISPPWYPPVLDYQPPQPAADQWQTWTWDAAIKRWVSVPTLAAHKRDAKQRMAAAWNTARQAGVTIGGKIAPTDSDAWVRYLAIKQMAADGGWIDVPIPLLDGSFHLLTLTQAGQLWTALKAMERDLLTRLRERVDAVNAATTQAQVEAVTW